MAPSQSRDGIGTAMVRAVRKCVAHVFNVMPPEPANEVIDLLASLKMTPRQVWMLYGTFQQLKQYDSLTLQTGPDEASTASMTRLVRHKRRWIEKIILLLLELAGFQATVTWDGFLFVFLQFCTLSKLELCQVMFFIIAKDMKSWTVDYLTSSQLEEFFEEYEDCPVRSFNTGSIDFTRLPLAKYRMTDFIELLYRFSQLINPCVHLQRSLQECMPSMRFWGNFDHIKPLNRKITIDFFRHKKVTSLVDMVIQMKASQANRQGVKTAQQHAKDLALARLPMQMYEDTPDTKLQAVVKAVTAAKEDPEVAECVPIPPSSLGLYIPPRRKRDHGPIVPGWLREANTINVDLTGTTTTDSPRGEHRPWDAGAAPRSIEGALSKIKSTFGPPLPKKVKPNEFIVSLQPRSSEERDASIARAQELDFISKSRHNEPRRDDMVTIMDRFCQFELIPRPQKHVAGHL